MATPFTLLHRPVRTTLKEIDMHYAKVLDNKVVSVIVAETEFFNTFVDSSPGTWIQTSYNTVGGVHLKGGTPLRKNYAGIGFTYDATRDAFIPPKPDGEFTLNDETCLWEATAK